VFLLHDLGSNFMQLDEVSFSVNNNSSTQPRMQLVHTLFAFSLDLPNVQSPLYHAIMRLLKELYRVEPSVSYRLLHFLFYHYSRSNSTSISDSPATSSGAYKEIEKLYTEPKPIQVLKDDMDPYFNFVYRIINSQDEDATRQMFLSDCKVFTLLYLIDFLNKYLISLTHLFSSG
jgi:hypothetical protein